MNERRNPDTDLRSGGTEFAATSAVAAQRAVAHRGPPFWFLRLLIAYLVSRVLVAGAVAIAIYLVPKSVEYYFERWDSFWYLRVTEYGYPVEIYEAVPGYRGNEIAFFPAFPMLVRAVAWPLGGREVLAAYLVNFVLGFALLVIMRLLFARLVEERMADRAVLLFTFFPGTAVFSLPYAEPLALTAAALCLYFLMSQRWVLAGLIGAVATASKPNMLPLVLACAAAAIFVIWQRKDWLALAAPTLSSCGILTFFAYLQWQTGDFLAWFHHEDVMWNTERDFGLHLAGEIMAGLTSLDFDTTPGVLLKLGGAIVAIVGLATLIRLRPPPAVLLFCMGVLAMALLNSGDIGTRPRFVAAAFPLFLGVATVLGPRLLRTAVAVSAFLLFATTGLYMGGTTVP